jgi:hypothetical protein
MCFQERFRDRYVPERRVSLAGGNTTFGVSFKPKVRFAIRAAGGQRVLSEMQQLIVQHNYKPNQRLETEARQE